MHVMLRMMHQWFSPYLTMTAVHGMICVGVVDGADDNLAAALLDVDSGAFEIYVKFSKSRVKV